MNRSSNRFIFAARLALSTIVGVVWIALIHVTVGWFATTYSSQDHTSDVTMLVAGGWLSDVILYLPASVLAAFALVMINPKGMTISTCCAIAAALIVVPPVAVDIALLKDMAAWKVIYHLGNLVLLVGLIPSLCAVMLLAHKRFLRAL